MTQTFIRPYLPLLIASALMCARAAEGRDADTNQAFTATRFSPKVAIDFGEIVRGKTGSEEFRNQPMNRNTLVLSMEGRYGEDWAFKSGLMGFLWWPFNTNPTEPVNRTMRSEIRIYEASAKRSFTDSETDPRFLELGYLRYKYNRDAHNLGEYLYRSGTYPGIVTTTDGFQLMDDALFETLGAHFRYTHGGGMISHDINLFAETFMAPVGDLTPAYEVSLNLPLLQLGAGAAWNRGIAWRPSRLRPKTPDNAFAKVTDVQTDASGKTDTVVIAGRLDQIAAFAPIDTAILGYWTKRGVKLMARGALDLGFLLPDGLRGTEDLRIFAEAAVLGWENQGFFYENRRQRIPVMVGLNVPTFRALDLLSIQTEYYPARFDNIQSYTTSSFPVWDVESFSTYDPSKYRRDDWKWSIYAVRSLGKLARFRAQVANDHLRPREFLLQQSDETVTRRPSHWYYLLRLEFGV
jgi:hypothetical protein